MKLVVLSALAATLGSAASACSGGGGSPADAGIPEFAADYASSYTEVRNCRHSGDHDLNYIRVLADPDALEPYMNRDNPFPVDSVVMKEEFEFDDVTCEGPLKQWTVMKKLADGDPNVPSSGWTWQKVSADRTVVSEDKDTCMGCHDMCGVLPDGYDGTCTMP
jgi:Cytochrome P460